MKLQVNRPGDGPWPVAFDGVHIVEVRNGEVYDFPADMAEVWLERGWLKQPGAVLAVSVEAPENKMAEVPEPPITKPHKAIRRGRK